MTTPSRRVFTAAEFARRRPVEHAFNALTSSRSCLRLLCPDWLQDAKHMGHVHRSDRHIANHRVSIGCQRSGPCRGVLWISPALAVRRDVCLSALLEGFAIGLLCDFRRSLFSLRL